MTWPFENDTRKIEKKLAKKSFQANRTRNIIAIISIILTTILFTGLFTLQRGLTESTERADMILSGGDGHARIIDLNQSEYDTILRYPSDKEDLTGTAYEPWHYRYVGRNAAEEIYHQGICLEEYIIKLE